MEVSQLDIVVLSSDIPKQSPSNPQAFGQQRTPLKFPTRQAQPSITAKRHTAQHGAFATPEGPHKIVPGKEPGRMGVTASAMMGFTS